MDPFLFLLPLFGFVAMAAIVGTPVVSVRLARAWDGGWRLLAALPAAAYAFITARLAFDLSRDPTSHNLWPFEYAMATGASVLWLALLLLVRRMSGGSVPPLLARPGRGGASRREWNVGERWREAVLSPSPPLRAGAGIFGGWLLLQGIAGLTAGAGRNAAGAIVVAGALLWMAVVGRWPGR